MVGTSFAVGGRRVDGFVVGRSTVGDLAPPILDGHRPRAADEIALGTRTLRSLGLHVGVPWGEPPQKWGDTHPRRPEALAAVYVRCRQDLADPTLAHRSVSAIAARWGFTDPAQFSRAFRAAYDLAPTEYRRAAGTTGSG